MFVQPPTNLYGARSPIRRWKWHSSGKLQDFKNMVVSIPLHLKLSSGPIVIPNLLLRCHGILVKWCFGVCSTRIPEKTWAISIMYHYRGAWKRGYFSTVNEARVFISYRALLTWHLNEIGIYLDSGHLFLYHVAPLMSQNDVPTKLIVWFEATTSIKQFGLLCWVKHWKPSRKIKMTTMSMLYNHYKKRRHSQTCT